MAIAVLGTTTLSADDHPLYKNRPKINDQIPKNHQLIVAYYGHPGISSLGVLGQYPIGQLKHIAIDPEFEISSLHVRPGKKIGRISGKWINDGSAKGTEIKDQVSAKVHQLSVNV